MRRFFFMAPALMALWAVLLFGAPAALAQTTEGQAVTLPGSESWQPYLDQSPVEPEQFAQDPLGAVRELLPEDLPGTIRQAVGGYADVLLFLLVVLLLSFTVGQQIGGDLLDLVAAGGCGVLVWSRLMELASLMCEKLAGWRTFLLGFLPVYAGVLTAGGEPAAGTAASGLLLTALCLIAQLLCAWVQPLLQCYLALSVSCCISTEAGLAAACRMAGRLLRQGLVWAGRLFAALLGLQRVFTAGLDRASVRVGKLLTGTVPVIGQALGDAAETVLSGMQLLKSGLGLAAMVTLGAEFVPLYLYLLLHAALLAGCGLLCSLTGIRRCQALFECLREAVLCMAAATALFFGLAVLGTALMFAVGGG